MMNINISTRLRRSTMENPSSNSIQRFLVFLLCLLPLYRSSLAYSLKNCSFVFDEDDLAEFLLDCSFNNLLTVPDDIPGDAHTLQLSRNLIRRINKNDFGNMSRLSFLSLDANLISHVDDGSFVNLVSLKELRIADNQLTHLTSHVFQGLSNLTELDLSNNSLSFFDNSVFFFLTSLQTVTLDLNKLKKAADLQPILHLPQLQALSIKDNLFSTFESKDLDPNVSSLRELNVEGNDLRRFSITTPVFPHLQIINLGQCGKLSPFQWDIPDKALLRNITQLDFSRSSAFEEIQKVLQSLDTLKQLQLTFMAGFMGKELLASICRIPTLQSLDLSFNHDPNLSAKLGACSQIKELDLSFTNISELPLRSIGMMKQLRSLGLEENALTKVPEDIRSLSSLRLLKLNQNLISELSCEDFTNTFLLTELSVAGNLISKLDWCVFKSLNNLKVLDLSDNPLTTFGETFKLSLKNLEVLSLRNHFLNHLERDVFEGLVSLKQIDLKSESEITGVEKGAFKGLQNLTSLNISLSDDFDCNFQDLDQMEDLTIDFPYTVSFQRHHENLEKLDFHLKSLKRLKMVCSDIHLLTTEAHIEMIKSATLLEKFMADHIFFSTPKQGTFQSNSRLRSLAITLADLSDLGPELFWPIPNLEELDLSSSKLKSLDFLAQANLSALKYLFLSDNGITVISDTIFQSLPALLYLDLSNNPLTCDCSNAGFIQWVKSNNQTQVDYAHEYVCSSPLIKQGTKVLDFDVQSCWMDVGFLCYISSSCLVVLTLLTSFIYHFLRWQIVYAFLLFQAFLYDSRKRRRGAPHLYDAFISYNVEDEAWVYREMLPVLEGEQGWRLCLHHRDFQPGKPIIENITDAIYSCRKTICVISRSYLQSEWCSREIQMASFRLFDEKKDVLVLLFLEDIPSHQLSPYHRMRKLVKKRTYLSWPQAGQHKGVFWQNVRRALETGESTRDDAILLTRQEGC